MAKKRKRNSKNSSPPSISPPDSPTRVKLKPNTSDSGTSSKPCPPQVNNKLWNRFYEPLVLLAAYGKSQGHHTKSKVIVCQDDDRPWIQKFLDQLAYICYYTPGGDTVTAIAIQDGPQPTYWVAANTNTTSKVKPFLNSILQKLEKVYNASGDELKVLAIRNQISDEAAKFCSKKLDLYRAKLRDSISRCLSSLEQQGTKETDDLKQWLLSLRDTAADSETLCRLCYEARNSEMMKALKHRADACTMQRDITSQNAKYSRIRHLIGRLGSHIKAADILVQAGGLYPQLFTDYSIEIATYHPNFTPPAYRSKSSINDIINRMVKDPSLCRYYQSEIHSQNQKFNLELEERIRNEYKDPSFKLRVHAEIILLDLFHRKDFQFFERVRYIGVSKPSCFLCYRYLQAHPLRAQTSGCSNNLYLQWQPPYIHEDSPPLVKAQEDILNAMIKEIRETVLDKIVPGFQGFKSHPDSTTGIDTLLHTNEAPYSLNQTRKKPEQSVLPYETYIDVSAHKPVCSNTVDAAGELNNESDGGVPSFQYVECPDDGGVSLFSYEPN